MTVKEFHRFQSGPQPQKAHCQTIGSKRDTAARASTFLLQAQSATSKLLCCLLCLASAASFCLLLALMQPVPSPKHPGEWALQTLEDLLSRLNPESKSLPQHGQWNVLQRLSSQCSLIADHETTTQLLEEREFQEEFPCGRTCMCPVGTGRQVQSVVACESVPRAAAAHHQILQQFSRQFAGSCVVLSILMVGGMNE